MRNFFSSRRRTICILATLAGVLVLFAFLQTDYLFTPRVASVSPSVDRAPLDTTITVAFSRPVDRTGLDVVLEPSVEGEWRYEKPVYGKHLYRTLQFVPRFTLSPETTYTVQLSNVQSAFHIGETHAAHYSFTTRALPNVTAVTPAKAATGITPTATIGLTLDGPNPDLAEFEIVLSPKTPVKEELNSTLDQYTLTPKKPLRQGIKYHLTVYRTNVVRDTESKDVVHRDDPVKVYTGTFSTTPPPNIGEILPTGDQVLITDDVSALFSEPMDLASLKEHFAIAPDVKGDLKLSEDGRTFTFAPAKAFAYGTQYDVTIAAKTKTRSGGYLEKKTEFSFTTIGAVTVLRTVPRDTAGGIGAGNSIQIEFDQNVDHASAEKHFSMEPAVAGSFNWEDNTLRFKPKSSLTRNTRYAVRIASGVKSVHSLDLADDHAFSFTTEPEVFNLGIKVDLQDQALSCEAAALKMALAGKGVFVSESDIMQYVGYDPTPHVGGTWGDPYIAYVGDIRGKQNTTGYGVYWGPIAKAASHWRPAEAFTGWSVAQVTKEVAKGNPVVVWGVYGSGYENSWQTPEGKHIYAWKGEHARTVVGYVGSAADPSQIILNDPYAGRIYWSRARFEQDWGIFGNAGVVVR